jgi:hypothetical protein
VYPNNYSSLANYQIRSSLQFELITKQKHRFKLICLICLIKRLSNAWYVGSPGLTSLIDELQECKTGLAQELSLWKDQAALESAMRRQAEEEVNQLKETLQEAQKDNRKLEQHVPEWKLIAEKSRNCTVKYCGGVSKIWEALEELRSEPACDGMPLAEQAVNSNSRVEGRRRLNNHVQDLMAGRGTREGV